MQPWKTPPPTKWDRAPRGYNRDLGLLVRGVFEHRDAILESYPLVKLPSDNRRISTPVAALILAWERWDYVQGDCPDCGARALGISFGGMLSMGSVGGVCTQCSLVVMRYIGGIGLAANGARASVAGTPYKFRFVNWRWGFRGIPRRLVSVLRKLGVQELPTSSSGADQPPSEFFGWTIDG